MEEEEKFPLQAYGTRVVEGIESTTKLTIKTLSQIEKVLCGYGDKEVPRVFVENKLFFKLFNELRRHGVEVSYVTEITPDNIQYCKQMVEALGFKLRHLDELKGNFAVADRSRQYWSSIRIPTRGEGYLQPQLVWSNISAVVEQNQYVFDLLWNRARPAEMRFKEIEEGLPRYETRIIRDSNRILAETKRMADGSRRYSVSSVSGGLLYAYNFTFDSFKKILEEYGRKDHQGIRWLTNIDQSNVEAAKKFLELGMIIRHLDNVPKESFGVSEKEVGVTISRMEDGSLNNSALFSNDPMYVEHYSAHFEELWKSGMDAKIRIKEIEEGIEGPRVRIIRNRSDVQELYLRLVNEAREEILLLLPTSNAYRHQTNIGVIDAMQAATTRGAKIRVLVPAIGMKEGGSTEKPEKIGSGSKNLIEYKPIREATGLNTVTIVVVDRTRSLIIEQRDDSKHDFVESIGVSTYSSRDSTVKANIRFFERMWEEVEEREREEVLLEKERRSRIEAELLQDILAHDIQNYNQAARLNAELLEEELEGIPGKSLTPLVESLINSIDGSTRLVERAAKIGKILTEGSNIRLFPVNLDETIENALRVVRMSQPEKEIVLKKLGQQHGDFVLADDMLQEAFVNLFYNSAKYTDEKDVWIEAQIEHAAEEEQNGTKGDYYKISVADHGHGIPDDLKSDLFTRYLKSARGNGLGLSIVQALVSDRYHGRIVVRDRVKGDHTKGTVMEILLPKAPPS